MSARRPVPATTLQHATVASQSRPVEAPDAVINLRDRLLLTVEQAADRLSVSRSLMYELIGQGRVGSIRVGRLRRVPSEALTEYVASLRRQASSPDSAA